MHELYYARNFQFWFLVPRSPPDSHKNYENLADRSKLVSGGQKMAIGCQNKWINGVSINCVSKQNRKTLKQSKECLNNVYKWANVFHVKSAGEDLLVKSEGCADHMDALVAFKNFKKDNPNKTGPDHSKPQQMCEIEHKSQWLWYLPLLQLISWWHPFCLPCKVCNYNPGANVRTQT